MCVCVNRRAFLLGFKLKKWVKLKGLVKWSIYMCVRVRNLVFMSCHLKKIPYSLECGKLKTCLMCKKQNNPVFMVTFNKIINKMVIKSLKKAVSYGEDGNFHAF